MIRRMRGYGYVAAEHLRTLVDLIQIGGVMIALLIGGIVGYLIGKRT